MNYEIIQMNKKTFIGFKNRIKDDETMPEKIRNLWKKLYSENGIHCINNRINNNSIGMYYNYNNKNGFEYDFFAGCETNNIIEKIPENMVKIDIPEGKYAKFIIFGNPERAVSEFWINFWEKFEKESSEIRNYTYDFEEYIDGDDYENMEIHIYIGIK